MSVEDAISSQSQLHEYPLKPILSREISVGAVISGAVGHCPQPVPAGRRDRGSIYRRLLSGATSAGGASATGSARRDGGPGVGVGAVWVEAGWSFIPWAARRFVWHSHRRKSLGAQRLRGTLGLFGLLRGAVPNRWWCLDERSLLERLRPPFGWGTASA